ncbi:MAG: hypothetical protein HY717_00875 [Planctomycetes bacterium]|nr:hypothetical protein [Planctomycetota bacterium]
MSGRWRQNLALLGKEVELLSARKSFWAGKFLILAVPFAFLLIALWLGKGLEASGERAGSTSRALSAALFLSGYAAALFIGPALLAGALEEERNRGLLEVYIASPLTAGQILLAAAGGRLIVAAQFFIAAIPLYCMLLHLFPVICSMKLYSRLSNWLNSH